MTAPQHPSLPELDQDGTVLAATDWLGNRFAVGELVLYCVKDGQGQMMALGRVLKIKTETKYDYFSNPFELVSVQVLTAKTSGQSNNTTRTKPAWVNPLNITAIKGLDTVEIT